MSNLEYEAKSLFLKGKLLFADLQKLKKSTMGGRDCYQTSLKILKTDTKQLKGFLAELKRCCKSLNFKSAEAEAKFYKTWKNYKFKDGEILSDGDYDHSDYYILGPFKSFEKPQLYEVKNKTAFPLNEKTKLFSGDEVILEIKFSAYNIKGFTIGSYVNSCTLLKKAEQNIVNSSYSEICKKFNFKPVDISQDVKSKVEDLEDEDLEDEDLEDEEVAKKKVEAVADFDEADEDLEDEDLEDEEVAKKKVAKKKVAKKKVAKKKVAKKKVEAVADFDEADEDLDSVHDDMLED